MVFWRVSHLWLLVRFNSAHTIDSCITLSPVSSYATALVIVLVEALTEPSTHTQDRGYFRANHNSYDHNGRYHFYD